MSQPLFASRLGAVRAAIFPNSDESGKFRGYSVSLSKSYYDAKDQKTKYLRCSLAADEVSAAIKVLQSVEDRLLTLDTPTNGAADEE